MHFFVAFIVFVKYSNPKRNFFALFQNFLVFYNNCFRILEIVKWRGILAWIGLTRFTITKHLFHLIIMYTSTTLSQEQQVYISYCTMPNTVDFWDVQNSWAKKFPFPPKPNLSCHFRGSIMGAKPWSLWHRRTTLTSRVAQFYHYI